MHHEELSEESLNNLKTAWSLSDDSILSGEIDRIIGGKMFGDITNRLDYQSTYFALADEDGTHALAQIIVSGDGRSKTIKLQDLLLSPKVVQLETDKRKQIVMCALSLLVRSGIQIENTGNHAVRVLKMYGRTNEIIDGLRLLADDLVEAVSENDITIKLQGRWFEMIPRR